MDDDSYELISRSELNALKNENNKLKKQIEEKDKNIEEKDNQIKSLQEQLSDSKINQETESKRTPKKEISPGEVTNIDKETIESVLDKFAKQQESIFKEEIEKVSKLNKSAVDNIVSSNQTQNEKFESLTKDIKEIIRNVYELISDSQKESSQKKSNEEENFNQEIKKQLEEIRNDIALQELESDNDQIEEVKEKLDRIDDFLKKLEYLLSQIKPSDMKM